jgi:hypothetical protein
MKLKNFSRQRAAKYFYDNIFNSTSEEKIRSQCKQIINKHDLKKNESINSLLSLTSSMLAPDGPHQNPYMFEYDIQENITQSESELNAVQNDEPREENVSSVIASLLDSLVDRIVKENENLEQQ